MYVNLIRLVPLHHRVAILSGFRSFSAEPCEGQKSWDSDTHHRHSEGRQNAINITGQRVKCEDGARMNSAPRFFSFGLFFFFLSFFRDNKTVRTEECNIKFTMSAHFIARRRFIRAGVYVFSRRFMLDVPYMENQNIVARCTFISALHNRGETFLFGVAVLLRLRKPLIFSIKISYSYRYCSKFRDNYLLLYI